jgi:signal transduction histidine kinase
MASGRFTVELRLVRVVCVVVGLAVAAGAGTADRSSGAGWGDVVLDCSVGLVFVGAAVIARIDVAATVGVAAVGWAWLLASSVSQTDSWHRGVLLLSLAVWSLRPMPRPAWQASAYAAALALFLGLGGQPVAAALLVAAAATLVVAGQGADPVRWHAAVSLATVGLVLGGSWTWSRVAPDRFHPVAALRVYELTLLLVAVTLVAARHVGRVRSRGGLQAALQVLPSGGLEPFVVLLRRALRDPTVEVREVPDCLGAVGDRTSTRGSLVVEDRDGTPMGVVLHDSRALEDSVTAARVVDATRLAVHHVRLNQALAEQLRMREDTRQRLLSVVDRERAVAADELRGVVRPVLEHAAQDIAEALERAADLAVAEPARMAAKEVATTSAELGRLVDGVAPFELGDGRLANALSALAASSPLAVHVRADADVKGDAPLERALYFACSEALANAHKHSRATQVQLCLERRDGLLVAEVSDDGIGGADATGAGMTGIADRLAVLGGWLQVVSPRGEGTVVAAFVPHPGIS